MRVKIVARALRPAARLTVRGGVIALATTSVASPAAADPAVPVVDAERTPVDMVNHFKFLDQAGDDIVFAASPLEDDDTTEQLWRLRTGQQPSRVGDYEYSNYFAGPLDASLTPTEDRQWIIVGSGKTSTAVDLASGATTRLPSSGAFPAAGSSFLVPLKGGLGRLDRPGGAIEPLPVTYRGRTRTTLSRTFLRRVLLGGNHAGRTGLCYSEDRRNRSALAIVHDTSRPVAFTTVPDVHGGCRLSEDGSTVATSGTRIRGRAHTAYAAALRNGRRILVKAATTRRRDTFFTFRSVSTTGRYVVLTTGFDPEEPAGSVVLVDLDQRRARRLPQNLTPVAWSEDDRAVVFKKGTRLFATSLPSGRPRELADGYAALPAGYTRDNRLNAPRVVRFTTDARAVVVSVVADSREISWDRYFGVRLPLDGSAGRLLPLAGVESFSDLVFAPDRSRAFLITFNSRYPVRLLKTSDADNAGWGY